MQCEIGEKERYISARTLYAINRTIDIVRLDVTAKPVSAVSSSKEYMNFEEKKKHMKILLWRTDEME